jgi:hypothetical protein
MFPIVQVILCVDKENPSAIFYVGLFNKTGYTPIIQPDPAMWYSEEEHDRPSINGEHPKSICFIIWLIVVS